LPRLEKTEGEIAAQTGFSGKERPLELGATQDGEPGERVPGMFYRAFFRDPDGHNICLAKFGS